MIPTRKLLIFFVFSALWTVSASPAYARERPPHPRQAEIDSLMQAAGERLSAQDAKEAFVLFTQVTQIDSTFAPAYRMLGTLWLRAYRLEEAEQAYQRARKIDDSADAWFGLGLVAVTSGTKPLKWKALTCFREAIQRDWNHAEARYQLAQTLYALGEPGAEFELQQLIRVNKTYKAAYLTLSRWEEPKPDGLKEALKWCDRGIKALPDDPDLLMRRAELRVSAGDHDRAVEELAALLRRRPDEVHFLPFLAQAHLARGRLKEAHETFGAYLDRLSPQDRACYEDISLVGNSEEVEGFQALEPDQTPEFLRQFWARRDLDLFEGVNRRRLEHYRRVWMARTHFSRGQKPWDRRGETYIRYGAPDFRQRSGGTDFKGGLDWKVQAVRKRMATFVYGAAAALEDTRTMKEIFRVLSNTDPSQGMDSTRVRYPIDASTDLARNGWFGPHLDQSGEIKMGLMEGPVYPVRANSMGYTIPAAGMSAAVPWESWVYARISGGIEFTFTDESLIDAFDFAPTPKVFQPSGKQGAAGLGLLARLREYTPEKVFTEVKAVIPALYIPPVPLKPLPAYVSLADFRGSRDTSQVEVYLGIPVKGIKLTGQSWQGQRTVVVYDRAWQEVHRSTEHSPLQVLPESRQEILDEIQVRLPPGDYFLAVKITEGDTGRTSLYQENLRVADYEGDDLQVSDIELARQIAPATQLDRFVKGKLRALPAPSRAFGSDQSVFVYFEVYNLKLDAQGKTRYRVDYTVRGQKGVGDLVLSGLGRLIGRSQKENEITVSYESAGEATQEVVHTALDLKTEKKGDYTLQVTITDLTSGAKAARETTFWIQK